jgi:hypothetical protein
MTLSSTPYSISCGGGLLAEHIGRFRFTPSIIQQLGQVTDPLGRCLFHESFLNHLQRLRLRIHVQAAPEGTLLFADEPLLLIQGPKIQALLLDSAFRLLIWESTFWATVSATNSEKKIPEATGYNSEIPPWAFNEAGWKKRAEYIGGGVISEDTKLDLWPGISFTKDDKQPLVKQIRRLFVGDTPVGDVWLSALDEKKASLSKTDISFQDSINNRPKEVVMSRFQNIYQPLLLKGHPILGTNRLDYLHQRTVKQFEIFGRTNPMEYPRGWFLG